MYSFDFINEINVLAHKEFIDYLKKYDSLENYDIHNYIHSSLVLEPLVTTIFLKNYSVDENKIVSFEHKFKSIKLILLDDIKIGQYYVDFIDHIRVVRNAKMHGSEIKSIKPKDEILDGLITIIVCVYNYYCGKKQNQPTRNELDEIIKSYKINNELYDNHERIIKCPACGELLNSFDAICPSCKYEIRNREVNEKLKRFINKLNDEKDKNNRIKIIDTEPIPNTFTDIFDFMFYASIQFNQEKYLDGSAKNTNSIEYLEAKVWLKKIEMCYHQSQLLEMEDAQHNRIKQIHDKINKPLLEYKEKEQAKHRKKKRVIIFSSIFGGIFGTIILFILLAIIITVVETSGKLNIYTKDDYYVNSNFDNNYKTIYDKQSATVYELKMASESRFVLLELDNSVTYVDGYYTCKSSYIKYDNVENELNKLLDLLGMEVTPLSNDLANRYGIKNGYDVFMKNLGEDAVSYINKHQKNIGDEGYKLLFSAKIDFYVYDIYNRLNETNEKFYTFTYEKNSFEFTLCNEEIGGNIYINEITVDYINSSKLIDYEIKYTDDNEYKITDDGIQKNVYHKIDLEKYSEVSLNTLKENEYTMLNIEMKFNMMLKYRGYQEFILSNSENYTEYLYKTKEAFTIETNKYNSYTIKYDGNIDDIIGGYLYIYYNASGDGDDDWFIKDIDITFTLSCNS